MRNGVDARLKTGAGTWREMLLQIARDYPGLPDARTLTIPEVLFFYNGVRDELKRYTRPKEPPPKAPRRTRKHGR